MRAISDGRRRRSLVVLGGDPGTSDLGARALADALEQAGFDIIYIGREPSAERIAGSAADLNADAVEVCLPGSGGARLLRALLQELEAVDCKNTNIVVHRVS
jgi:methylmalonyl-CoA mutase cobalamin-binding domain/chain